MEGIIRAVNGSINGDSSPSRDQKTGRTAFLNSYFGSRGFSVREKFHCRPLEGYDSGDHPKTGTSGLQYPAPAIKEKSLFGPSGKPPSGQPFKFACRLVIRALMAMIHRLFSEKRQGNWTTGCLQPVSADRGTSLLGTPFLTCGFSRGFFSEGEVGATILFDSSRSRFRRNSTTLAGCSENPASFISSSIFSCGFPSGSC